MIATASHHAQAASQQSSVVLHLCLQVVLFADDETVSKGMVKYASQITKESIVDVEGLLTCPEKSIDGCSQKDVSHAAKLCCYPVVLTVPYRL